MALDADVTVYAAGEDRRTFELPRHVLKSGQFVIENGELRPRVFGQTLHVAPSFDPADEADIANWIDEHYSIRAANYPVSDMTLGANRTVRVRRAPTER